MSNETMTDEAAIEVLNNAIHYAEKIIDSGEVQGFYDAIGHVTTRLRGDDPRSPSYAALLLIAQSVCGALERAGITDCDDPGEAIDVMRERYEARLRAEPEQQGRAVYLMRGEFGLWVEQSKAAHDWWEGKPNGPERRVLYTGPQPAAVAGGARDRVMGELEQWFDTQGVDVGAATDSVIAAMGDGPVQPVAGDAVREAAQFACDVLAEVYAKYQTKIGPFASQAQKANVQLRAALSAASAAPAPLDALPEGTPTMPPGRFWDGCWKNFPQPVQGYARMLTQSWRAADSTELKNALEAGILALGTASEQPASPVAGVPEGIVGEMRNFAEVADRCQITEGNASAVIRAWADRLAAAPQPAAEREVSRG